jgi:hypothetical protein
MKVNLLAAGLFLTCFLTPLIAQAQTPNSKVSLELGRVTVWLGMAQTDALLQLQSAGYQVLGTSTDRLIKDGKNMYSVSFETGRLIFASRDWYNEETKEIDAVLGALAALASHGSTLCSVQSAPINRPDESADRVFISCGERSVVLMRGHFASSKNSFVGAYEQIGQPR